MNNSPLGDSTTLSSATTPLDGPVAMFVRSLVERTVELERVVQGLLQTTATLQSALEDHGIRGLTPAPPTVPAAFPSQAGCVSPLHSTSAPPPFHR